MRVTQSSMSRNYLKALTRNLNNLNATTERMQTGLKLRRVSDNTSDASRAYAVREQLYKTETALVNIRDAYGELSSAEGSLMNANGILQLMQEKMIKLANGTYDASQRNVLAIEVENMQKQLIQLGNSQFGNKHLFSGTNNADIPFTLNANGDVTYNGTKIDDMVPYSATLPLSANAPTDYAYKDGIAMTEDPLNPGTFIPVNKNAPIYIDINLGLSLNGAKVDPMTAIKLSVSGTETFGFGRDANGLPNNLMSFAGDVIKALRSDDVTALRGLIDKSKGVLDGLIMSLTDIGTRTNFLNNSADRFESDIVTLKEVQNNLETSKIEEEATNYKIFERAWQVSLQLGAKVLPISLFDFMR